MGKFFSYLFSVLFLTTALVVGFWYAYNSYYKHSSPINSPIPDFLMLSKNNQVTILDFWSPIVQQIHGDTGNLSDLTAQSILMYDLTTNKILYEKDPDVRHPMASLTKIMSAIIALDTPKPDDKYIVTKTDMVTGDNMGVSSGETYDLQDLLYGLILHSGNDAAEVLANNYPGRRKA